MPRASLRIEGLKEAQLKVEKVGERARFPDMVLRSPGVRRALQESERRRFSRYRFRPDSKAWVARKRREGLSSKTMIATGRLKSALENANRSEGVIHEAYRSILTWGIVAGRSDVYYAAPLAKGGRSAVAIDRLARIDIAERVQHFIAYGFLD